MGLKESQMENWLLEKNLEDTKMNEKWFKTINKEVNINDCYKFKSWKPYHNERLFIVDIGANVGAFSAMASARFPKAEIHAFEFIEENYKFLKNKLQDTDVVCHNKAMIGSNKPIGFFYHKNNYGGHKPIFSKETSSYLSEKQFSPEWTKKEIDSISFFDFVEQHKIKRIDFLKLDCEGSEYEIFQQIEEKSLWKIIDNISFELHGPKADRKELLSMLGKHYSVTGDKMVHCRGPK